MPSVAAAQTNEAIAESLFIEGKQLFTEKKYAEACQKLAQSHRADPAGGTVLLLAMCYEQQGRTASAWAKYGEALALARRDGRPDREQRAQESMDALTPKLSYASVTLAPEAQQVRGMEFVLDDIGIPLLIDAKVPIDPGTHRLVVRANGYEPWAHEFQIGDPGAVVTITVPALVLQATNASATSSNAPVLSGTQQGTVNQSPALDKPTTSMTRNLGWIVGGAGLVAAGVGGYFAIQAKRLDKKSNDRCAAVDCGDSEALGWNRDALKDARISTWLVGLGAAAAVTGGALVLFGGNHGPNVTATAVALPQGAAFGIYGRY
jgi:hypothetical protein